MPDQRPSRATDAERDTSRLRVLVTRTLPPGALAPLDAEKFAIINRPNDVPFTREELIDAAADVDAIVSVLSDSIDAEVLRASRGRLRIVANVAVGHDNIDTTAAAELGVTVSNTPGVLDEATADVAFLLLLAAARQAREAESDLRSGRWHGWQLNDYLGKELHGATLGLVGFGRIAQAVERRATGFGMTTIHHTRTPTGLPGWTESLDELLARSDFISLHVPLSPATHHLIDEIRLAQMKSDAVLINTARGAVVDERALAEALHAGHLFGAGLDVFESEPALHPRLADAPRTVLLPHIGSATTLTRTRMATMACQAVADMLDGRQPRNIVTA